MRGIKDRSLSVVDVTSSNVEYLDIARVMFENPMYLLNLDVADLSKGQVGKIVVCRLRKVK